MAKGKVRLDALLVERGFFANRTKARAAIMAGIVYVDGKRGEKAGAPCDPDAEIEVRGADHPYVSRGGLKLAHALDAFGIDAEGKRCIDVGASTGGFTDCLLQRGARQVTAVDVGYGQLDWGLRQDPRVEVRERTNFRYVGPGDMAPAELIVIDVSFISLLKILPAVDGVLLPEGDVVALVKPQFEAGRGAVGKGGVVRDGRVRLAAVSGVIEGARRLGWVALGLVPSPIRGSKGNVEFLVHWRRAGEAPGDPAPLEEEALRRVVASAEAAASPSGDDVAGSPPE